VSFSTLGFAACGSAANPGAIAKINEAAIIKAIAVKRIDILLFSKIHRTRHQSFRRGAIKLKKKDL